MITEIMHIDNTFDDLSVTDRKKQRQLVLSEKVDAYFAWAKQKYSQATHNSTIGKALAYIPVICNGKAQKTGIFYNFISFFFL